MHAYTYAVAYIFVCTGGALNSGLKLDDRILQGNGENLIGVSMQVRERESVYVLARVRVCVFVHIP